MEVSLPEKIRRLRGNYGAVAREQNQEILKFVTGRSVLDIGCGYGALTAQLAGEDGRFDRVAGIDNDPAALEVARSLYKIDAAVGDAYALRFPDQSFDTVILREAAHHLDLERALPEIRRVCRKTLLIFDPNPHWILRLARRVIRHQDETLTLGACVQKLQANGFTVRKILYRDLIAFPLSGGLVGPRVWPEGRFWIRPLILLDRALARSLAAVGLLRFFAWRYLIKADHG